MVSRCTTRLFLLLLLFVPVIVHAQDNEACLQCHGDQSWLEDEDTKRLYVDPEVFANSIHGGFVSCVDCHADLAGKDPVGHDVPLAPVECDTCHDDVATQYAGSLHAYAREHGNFQAPDCSACHGTHNILPSSDENSPSNRKNVVQMCGTCHGSAGLLTDKLVRLPQAVQGYARSVHGQAFRRGIETAAVCIDCHGSHNLKGVLDPESKINPINVSKTCGRCHSDIETQYEQSIHGRALAAGIVDSPTCNTCHGEHQILSPKDANAATAAGHQAIQTCGRCHEDSRIVAKYGLADYVVETYVDSYHGWARRWDSPTAATCVRCHTAHWVLPARDPASTVSPQNVVETCRQCHPNADQAFAVSYTHETAAPGSNPVTSWLRFAYLILIPAVIGGMLLHNAVIVGYYLKKRRREQELSGAVHRLDRQQLIQHVLLTISFIVLVITGFALRFPDAFWVKPLAFAGMDESIRSVVHRIAAVVLLFTGFLHIVYIAANRHGKREFSALIPKWRDIQDMSANVRFYLGLKRRKPTFEQYDYTQKAEYWALVWGTIVMALTGFVLWFPERAVDIFPTWIVEASQLLHYYEAWLATLAILVWHFFFVIFHPDVYPMSWTWITGKMSAHEAEEHHGEWYDRITGEHEPE